jgi:mannosyltransferase OCH1-like enzyme
MQMKSMFPLTEPIGVSNDVMFATKGNAFFKQMIETLPETNRWYGLPYFTVLFSTGPMFLSLSCIQYHRTNVQDVMVLSPKLYSKSDTRFFRHLKGSTWHSFDAVVVKSALNNWPIVFATLIIAIIMRRRHRKERRLEIKPHRLSV